MNRLGVAVLVTLTLGACGRVGPPVPPEAREPAAAAALAVSAVEDAIEITWTNPDRRVDGTPLRDLTVAHVFRAEDAGDGPPRAALRSGRQVAGYAEVATIRLADPAPAVVDGARIRIADRQGLSPGRRYTYVVLTEDSLGRLSPPSPRLSIVYLAPPPSPAGLTGAAGDGEVRLAWQAPTRLADGSPLTGTLAYEVLRAPAPDTPREPVTPAPVAGTELTDRGLQNDRAYAYAVRALRTEAGGTSRGPLSEPVVVTPLDASAPAAPRNLVAVPAGADVRLAWAASPEPDVGRYVVYRTDERGVRTRVGSVTPPATTLVDRNVPAGRYRYTVTAQDSSSRANESPPSEEAAAVIP